MQVAFTCLNRQGRMTPRYSHGESKFFYARNTNECGIVACVCNSRILETEEGGLQVHGQPGVNSDILSQTNNQITETE